MTFEQKLVSWMFAASFVLVVLMAAVVAHGQTVAFSSNLYYGITHSDNVKALQEFLTEQGEYTGPISGNFFALTQAGVKKFQAENKLPVTGYFGVLSRGVANSLLATLTPEPPAAELGATSQGGVQDSGGGVQSAGSSPAQPSAPSGVGAIAAPAPQAPTCNLSASVGNFFGTTWQAHFAWTFTSGATATIKASGGTPNANLQFGPSSLVPINYQFGAVSSPYGGFQIYSSPIFQDTDYEMDVSLNGLTGSCTAHASVPNTPPKN